MADTKHGVSITWQRQRLIEKLALMPKPPAVWQFAYDPLDDEYEPTDEDRQYIAWQEARKAIIAQIDALSPSRARRRAA